MKTPLALLTLSFAAVIGCSLSAPDEASEAAEAEATSGSEWVRCEASTCKVFLTTDLSAALPGEASRFATMEDYAKRRAERPLTLDRVQDLLPAVGRGREMGVALKKGNLAVVSWRDAFYAPNVQIVSIGPGSGWRVFRKTTPVGSPPPGTPPGTEIVCKASAGCGVLALTDLRWQGTSMGAQACRQSVMAWLYDGASDRYVISPPMLDRANAVQVVRAGEWTDHTWDGPLVGECASDAALTAKQRCETTGGAWQETTCPSPACGFSLVCAPGQSPAAACACGPDRPFFDAVHGCVEGACSRRPGDPRCAAQACAAPVTCESAGGVCAEYAWPVLETRCPGGFSARTTRVGTCTGDSQGRPRNCCLPTR